jgi:dephospho-CoA kinase
MSGLKAKSAPDQGRAKLVIGLVGGMGSGKTLVAAELARRGGRLISGDQLGHEALRQPLIRSRIKEYWGTVVLDAEDNVDRLKLGRRVFSDARERKVLEELVFPFIERRITEEIAAARRDNGTAFIVLDAAIMLEAGWNKHCDLTVYVDASRPIRAQRLAKQRGWTEQDLEKRENAQWPVAEKRARADFVIDNSGLPEQITEQVTRLLAEWRLI